MANKEGLTYLDYTMVADRSVQAAQMDAPGRIRAKGGRLLKFRKGDYIELLSDGDIAVRRKTAFEAEFTVATAPSAPPTSLAATTQTLTGLRLTWTKGDAAAKTQVWKLVNGEYVLLATVAANTELYDVTGLPTPDTAYSFKIRHIRNETETAFTTVLVAYTIPVAPAAPTLTSKTATTILIAFVPVGTTTLTQVLVGGANNGAALAHATVSKNITSLTTATLYSITLKAVGAVSGLSSAASVALAVTTD